MIRYIHLNPEKHGFVRDFRDWEFSSWHTLISTQETYLSRKEVIEWFGSIDHFTEYHLAGEIHQAGIMTGTSFQSLTGNL